MKKQTSVEWLFDQIPLEWTIKRSAFDTLQQAKAIEKKQMINFALDYIETQCECGYTGDIDFKISAEDYFNETYNTDTP